MNTQLKHKVFFWISFILLFIQSQNEAFASHAQSADLTYKCLGGSQYQISLSFYRDCAGVAAPTTVSINVASASCAQNLNVTLNQIPGTGIEVSPICASLTTTCSGGVYPGVQQYKYTGIVTLPAACTDWVFSFSLCCRNASIGTILTPSSDNIYIEAHLDNLDFPCSSSPTFSNPPVPFVCVGQPYCYNNGAVDPDGDSLSYTLITPETGPGTTVTYIAPYTASQPLSSMPAVTFNNVTGDICMTPTALQVTVFAILVQKWRGEMLVGSVMRDIQLRTMTCTNNNPYTDGINNTGIYSLTACAGVPISFNISSYDLDSGQIVTITWDSGISGASFISSGGARPTATFSWTPTLADISTASHCFTVTVQDNNCPYYGSQTYSFCITVTGITLNTVTTPANCSLPNGTADVQVLSGTGPFTYQWLPGGETAATATGLAAGTYTVNVTDAAGCISSATTTVAAGAAPAAVAITSTNVSCYSGNNGSATANVTGGLAPYTYLWSSGATTPTINTLPAGIYNVTVTTANGCVTNVSVTITQPIAPLSYTLSQTNVTCNGLTNGSATIVITGGTGPYTYLWNTTPVQITPSATNLNAGTHSVIVTDNAGCSVNATVTITQPAALTANAMIINNVTCNGLSDGYATVGASGGTGPYNYMWNTTPVQYTQSISGLAPGNYTATVIDANGCNTTSTITITEPTPLLLTSAGFPATCNGLCNGQAVIIPAGGTPTYTYHWLPTGGASASANGLCPGTYTGTVTDANGCTAIANIIITQPAPIVTTATGSTTICLGQNTTISASATGGDGGYVFNWTSGAGAGATHTVSPTVPTTYSVTATDASGCVGSTASVNVNVTSLTAANLTVTGSTSICFGNSAVISSAVTGSTGPVTINWSGGLGSGNGPFTVAPATSTTYTVTVTDACGNFINASVPIVVNPLPVINIAPQSAEACSEVVLNFVDNSTTNTGAQYSWNFGDGTTSSQTSPIHSYTTSGTYNVSVFVTSTFGCTNTANTTCSVIVNPGTIAAFTAEAMDGTTISPIYKFNNSSVNAVSQIWYFGDGSTSTVVNPQHTYTGIGEYLVKLVTSTNAGCTDSVTIPIEIKPEFTLYVPNAFTPDGNGVNDYFTAKGQEINEFSMMIFDRWGELIYQTDDIGKGWDGKAKNGNQIVQTGVYVYKISVRDFENRYHDYTGHITLLASQ
jgi:gliding motility-associated-like protein